LIESDLFEAIAPQEKTFGWTIEAQVGAARLAPRFAKCPRANGRAWPENKKCRV